MKKMLTLAVVVLLAFGMMIPTAYCKDSKIGYVDLRRAFYEYEKTKTMERDLNVVTEDRQGERKTMIGKITKMRDESEMLSGDAQAKKQKEIEASLAALQEFDRTTRQDLINKKNDMFRDVIEDIQKVVKKLGEKDGYDYVMDSRNIIYAKPDYDLTDVVVKALNKK